MIGCPTLQVEFARRGNGRSQAIQIGLGRFSNGGAIVEEPQPGCVPIDSELASITRQPLRATYENVLQQDVQKLMYAGVDRKERYLMTMRIAERDDAQVIPVRPGGDT